jgi:hypothetical protein
MALSRNCLYGQSGVGKTAFLGMVIEWFVKKHNPKIKPIARLATCEDWATIEPYVKAGLLQVWTIGERDHPFETTELAVQGYWPEDLNNPVSKLIEPTGGIPLYFFEGLATWSDYMMGNWAEGGLAERAGLGHKSGPGTRPGEDMIAFKDGTVPVGGNSQSHYNTTQRQMHGRVVKSMRLPGHVFWTSHEMKAAKDEQGRPSPQFGPEVVGAAATPRVPRWFGNLMHVQLIPKTPTDEEKQNKLLVNPGEHVIFLKEHYDPSYPNIPFKAKLRVPVKEAGDYPLYISHTQDEVNELLDSLLG